MLVRVMTVVVLFELTAKLLLERPPIDSLLFAVALAVGIAPEMLEPVLLVECPRLLFPFARNILADVTRDGGFPPVLLAPIDFVALWQNRRAQQQVAAAPAQGNA